MFAYEFNWKKKFTKYEKVPVAWKNAYPDSQVKVITTENYIDWLKE
ncbi:MAG: hypothetical protein P8Z35_20670 [Ignavibacteriaceae bacterium]|jgi:hypothetical protein